MAVAGPWVRVAAATDVGGAPFLAVGVGGREVLLARTDDGSLYAFDAACPHLGNPLRHGHLTGCTLECPHHFYAYDLASGANVFPGDHADLRLAVHEVREVDGEVEVRLRGAEDGGDGGRA